MINRKLLTGMILSGTLAGVFGGVNENKVVHAQDFSQEENSFEQNSKMVVINTKLQARTALKAVVAGGRSAGYTMAAELLDHSLQDNPSARSYGAGTNISNKLANTSEHKNLLNTIKNKLKTLSGSSYTTSGSFGITSNTDLYLALHNVKYTVNCVKSNGVWKINFTYTDVYDYEYAAWKKYGTSLGSAAVTAMNNYAATAQKLGAVVPYNITIKVSATY